MKETNRSPDVIVLLSSYNGGEYIAEQIESIQAQTVHDWLLVVRDDGSSDDTTEIVGRYAAQDPRISMLEDGDGNLGPWGSFGKLLAFAAEQRAEYIFLSDQDDVWLPDKIERQLSLLKAAVSSKGKERPVLVHSDLVVVDAGLQPIHASFSRFQRMSYDAADPLRTLLIHNAVTGCTIAMNRSLLGAALPLPSGSMHDWWLALCAAAHGTILCTDSPTVRYRQHSQNVVGAPPRHAFLRKLLRNPLAYTAGAFREFGIGVTQALQLRDRMSSMDLGDLRQFRRVENYCAAFAEDKGLITRLRALVNSKARPRRALSQLILFGIAASYPAMRSFADRSALPETR